MGFIPGFPTARGGKRECVITKVGPTSYTVITTGAPPTGGQDVTAAEFGMKYIEFLEASACDNGLHVIRCIPTSSSPKCTVWKLQWCLAISGQETSGSLDEYTVRLHAIGI
jgi:hypothetical protein